MCCLLWILGQTISILPVQAPDVSRDSGEVPGTVNGQVEFQDIIFHYPSRPQVTVGP